MYRSISQRCFIALVVSGCFSAMLLMGSPATAQEAQEDEREDEQAATAQEADEDEREDEQALELQDVKVTGSRLNRPPSELSGNLIVLDRDAIRASGELTLARVLRQLPQNINATNETLGSTFNGVENRTGAATVNLRGLGSESTLILIDGRRVGYSGILGGVTDVSTIPLSMVERIEILLDGASAIYGSDAVGGVVNIITREDYSGVEVGLHYNRPDEGGFDETRADVSAGFSWNGGRAKVGYEFFSDSGLESSHRDSITQEQRLYRGTQKNNVPGPQLRAYTWFFDDSCNAQRAVVYQLDGNVISRDAYAALDAADQARAICRSDVTLPRGFQHTDDLNSITQFGQAPQQWGEEAEVGYSLRPERRSDSLYFGLDQDISDTLKLHANVRYTVKDSNSSAGLPLRSATLHQNSPFNPFGVRVSLVGLAVDQPPQDYESETTVLNYGFGVEGSIAGWTWEAEFSSSREEQDTSRFNVRDPAYGLGVNSDGVSEAIIQRISGIDEAACEAARAAAGGSRYSYSSFFGGNCTIYGAPPDPINPFGDISAWIIPDRDAGSENEQTELEFIVRGSPFSLPGGNVALVAGFDWREDSLDSFSEISSCCGLFSPGAATGTSPFNTSVSRETQGVFFEGLIPLVGSDNAMSGARRLNLIVSGRYDSYSDADVDYGASDTDSGGTLENSADPGDEFTWQVGLVYNPTESLRVKFNRSTSFVAPQLNQLLSKIESVPTACFWHYLDATQTGIGQLCDNVTENRGGNETLEPETADTTSYSVEWAPTFLSGLLLKASWSNTEYVDRIAKLRTPIADLQDLPSTITYFPEDDLYIVDNRWINISEVERDGTDLEIRYDWVRGFNEFSILLRRAYTHTYDVIQDAGSDTVHDIVTTRDDSGPEDTVISPVPEHKTNMQFTWSRGGMFLALDMQAADDTSIIRTTGAGLQELLTEPATNFDLVLGYELGSNTLFSAPGWLSGLTATFTINNLTNEFADNTLVDLETGEVEQFTLNPYYEWTQGRSYNLSLRLSL